VTDPAVTRRDVGFRSERGPVLIALMLTTGVVAIDATILATAVPTIVDELGGFSSFPWLFSVYLLAQAVSVPIYSKIADTVGRKPVVLLGIALFLLGSILCGFAWSMPALIAFRVVQGLGAGAVQPMSITITGDIYSVRERAAVQGYLASVWAISSVVGPTLGGVFSEFVSWRWIFFINIPLCLLAAWMLQRKYHEKVDRVRRRVDYAGGAFLTAALTLLLLGVLEGGLSWEWDSPQSIGIFAAGAALAIVFVLVERRAEEPVLPLWAFSRRVLGVAALISAGVGAILIGLTSYVPTYLQGVLGISPIVAGLALAALTIGWPIAASQSGRLYLRFGFRATVLFGCVLSLIGTGGLALVASSPSVLLVALCCFMVGLGLGFVASPSLIAAQSSVDWNERGVATGANLFARSVGSAVGVAIFGALANASFAAAGASEDDPAAVLDASAIVFVGVAVVSVALFAVAFAMPRGRVPSDAATAPPAAGRPEESSAHE
jgi:EmrB/QacA subfamily drug resistance transporter